MDEDSKMATQAPLTQACGEADLIYSLLSFRILPFNTPPLHLPELLSAAEYLC